LLEGSEVRCEPRDHDRHGRAVAVRTVAGSDVAVPMVREDWALNFER
jgi:endonuclease YncB( thermonuclease family)